MKFPEFVPKLFGKKNEDPEPKLINERLVTIPSREEMFGRFQKLILAEISQNVNLQKIITEVSEDLNIQESLLRRILPNVGQRIDYRFIGGKVGHTVYEYFRGKKVPEEQLDVLRDFLISSLIDAIIIDPTIAEEAKTYNKSLAAEEEKILNSLRSRKH